MCSPDCVLPRPKSSWIAAISTVVVGLKTFATLSDPTTEADAAPRHRSQRAASTQPFDVSNRQVDAAQIPVQTAVVRLEEAQFSR